MVKIDPPKSFVSKSSYPLDQVFNLIGFIEYSEHSNSKSKVAIRNRKKVLYPVYQSEYDGKKIIVKCDSEGNSYERQSL